MRKKCSHGVPSGDRRIFFRSKRAILFGEGSKTFPTLNRTNILFENEKKKAFRRGIQSNKSGVFTKVLVGLEYCSEASLRFWFDVRVHVTRRIWRSATHTTYATIESALSGGKWSNERVRVRKRPGNYRASAALCVTARVVRARSRHAGTAVSVLARRSCTATAVTHTYAGKMRFCGRASRRFVGRPSNNGCGNAVEWLLSISRIINNNVTREHENLKPRQLRNNTVRYAEAVDTGKCFFFRFSTFACFFLPDDGIEQQTRIKKSVGMHGVKTSMMPRRFAFSNKFINASHQVPTAFL